SRQHRRRTCGRGDRSRVTWTWSLADSPCSLQTMFPPLRGYREGEVSASYADGGVMSQRVFMTPPSAARTPPQASLGEEKTQASNTQAIIAMPITDTNQASVLSQGTPIR